MTDRDTNDKINKLMKRIQYLEHVVAAFIAGWEPWEVDDRFEVEARLGNGMPVLGDVE